IFLPDRSIIFGGEKLTNGVLDKIKESNSDVAVYNHYGPTETTVGKLIHKVDLDRDYTNIPIGKPFSNSGVYVLDSNMHLVPIGVVGELYIDGLGVSQGYLNNAGLTTETFVSHPFNEGARMYKTGDLALWSEEGTIEFMGRADDQVKIRGHRVEVKEIESILNELDHISQSLVISQSDDSGSIRLIAYIVSDEAVLDIMGIDDALKGDLPDYMIPSVYEKLDAIPLTENGKVDYKALPKVTAGVVGPAREYVGPETDEEKALVAAWESVLKKERVSIKDNFYQLGGDSLKSIQMFVLLKKKGYDLPIVDIIENPILEDMAKTIKRISNQDNQFDILQSKTIEKSIEVSKNQKYFIKRPWAFILSNTISLSGFSESTFEKKILNLLGCYPSLCVEFEEHENDILQHRISSEKIKLAVKLIRNYDKNNLEKIEKKAKSFLEVSFDYFNSTPLIRFFLVIDPKDPHKVFLRFCIAHALVDIDTFAHISENLQHHFDNPKIPKNEYSNFDFALWQKNFLYSKQGREQRKWWLDYLEPLPLIDTKIQNKESVKYIIQHSLIIGEQFDAIKETIKEINIPVSVLFLAAQQYLLNEIGEESYLQKVAVNGGEQNYEEGSVTKVIGVTTNFLPLRIIPPANKTFKEYIYNIYEEYLKVRLYQNVPYETIKEDSLKATNTDIDKGIKGYFNFRLKETKILEQNLLNKEVSVSYKEQHWSNVYGIGLICDLYKNGIAIRLLCPEYIYEDIRYDVSLVSFVKKKLLDSMNLTSKT
uniref:condensation domain-containing protein n=1 Tax=Aquimarina algiphila TaxID=2047982 RepID=UPI002493B030